MDLLTKDSGLLRIVCRYVERCQSTTLIGCSHAASTAPGPDAGLWFRQARRDPKIGEQWHFAMYSARPTTGAAGCCRIYGIDLCPEVKYTQPPEVTANRRLVGILG